MAHPRFYSLALFACSAVLLVPAISSAALIGSLTQHSPTPTSYVLGDDFLPVIDSPLTPFGGITAQMVGVDLTLPPTPVPSSTSGCEASDFGGDIVGRFALIQDGSCTIDVKVHNAAAAGAVGVIIFGEGQPGRTDVKITQFSLPAFLPTLYASFPIGHLLADAARVGAVFTLEITDSSMPTTTPVPEPGTLTLMMAGGLGLVSQFRRRTRP